MKEVVSAVVPVLVAVSPVTAGIEMVLLAVAEAVVAPTVEVTV